MCRTGKSNCRAAKMVVASTYKLSYLCSAESTVREGVKAAKSIDASGKNGCSYTCQATLSSIWLGFWMAE